MQQSQVHITPRTCRKLQWPCQSKHSSTPAPPHITSALPKTSNTATLNVNTQPKELTPPHHNPPPPNPEPPTTTLFPSAFGFGLATFSLVSYDIFSPDSLHLLSHYDISNHVLSTTIDSTWRATVADKLISNIFFTLSIMGWVSSSTMLLLRNLQPSKLQNQNSSPVPALCAAWLSYLLLCGGPIGDSLVVDNLKNVFARPRPSSIHHSFSFPSGHTTSTTFLVGVLLCVLLPALARTLENSDDANDKRVARMLRTLCSTQVAYSVWGTACVVTAVGRVLADAHWTSDTIAGMGLGLAIVSVVSLGESAVAGLLGSSVASVSEGEGERVGGREGEGVEVVQKEVVEVVQESSRRL